MENHLKIEKNVVIIGDSISINGENINLKPRLSQNVPKTSKF